jgi:hypothetical protein
MASKPTQPIRLPHPSKEPQERRAYTRKSCNLVVICSLFPQEAEAGLPAKMHNISANGVGLVLDRQIEGKTIMVQLQDQAGSFVLKKIARVRYVQAGGANQWLLGASFVKNLETDELSWLLDQPESA